MKATVRAVYVSVADVTATVHWFTEVLGLEVATTDGDHFVALRPTALSIVLVAGEDHPAPGTNAVAVKTDDLDALGQAARAAGLQLDRSPKAGAHEVRLVARDPSGAPYLLYEPLPQEE